MTRARQKVEERLYAEKASFLLGRSWCINDPPNEDEWPDLLVNDGDQDFGLEVRNLYPDEGVTGSSKRAGESKRVKQLRKAADCYYQNNLTAVNVKIFGDLGDPAKLAQNVAEAVESLRVWQQKKVRLGTGRWMYVSRLPDECGKYKRWILLSDAVGWVGHADSAMVQQAVFKKSVNLPKYKRHLEKISLLLVCDRTLNSGKFRFDNVKGLGTAGFEYVYLFSCPDQLIKISADEASLPEVFQR
jgi:hypothetical protein